MYPAPATSNFSKPSGMGDLGDDLFGDLARRLAQTLGQLERERQGKLAQLDLGRLVDDDVRQVDMVFLRRKART